ncbi:OsmC family protein [Brachybacterium sp. 107]|uniref:OsmC family protein n=1 Tax=Brachybacterium sp. 107 TaxID=3457736 RepID=UPI0040340B72
MVQPSTSSPRDPSSGALYTARVDNVDGTSGQVRVHEGPATLAPEVPSAELPEGAAPTPEALLPTGGPTAPARGFNPEQFLAMAWSTCLGETLRVVLAERGLPHESHVSVEVGLHRDPSGGYRFAPRALVTIDEMAADEAQPLLEAAHARCPVSKLLSGSSEPIVELQEPDRV